MGQLHAQDEMHIEGGQTERDRARQTDRLILFVIITNANNERFCMATGTGNSGAWGASRQTWTRCAEAGASSTGSQGNSLPDSTQNKHTSKLPPSACLLPPPPLAPVKAQQQPPKRDGCATRYTSKYVKPSRFAGWGKRNEAGEGRVWLQLDCCQSRMTAKWKVTTHFSRPEKLSTSRHSAISYNFLTYVFTARS